ncbi:MAG: cyclic nucleotide-binding domain-containing protein [Caldilineaceae bacterium]
MKAIGVLLLEDDSGKDRTMQRILPDSYQTDKCVFCGIFVENHLHSAPATARVAYHGAAHRESHPALCPERVTKNESAQMDVRQLNLRQKPRGTPAVNQHTLPVDPINQQLQASLRQATLHSRALTFTKGVNIYATGEHDSNVYFIESGQIKITMLTPEGSECLLAILTTGDIFGELCLSGRGERQETATAMTLRLCAPYPVRTFLCTHRVDCCPVLSTIWLCGLPTTTDHFQPQRDRGQRTTPGQNPVAAGAQTTGKQDPQQHPH